MAGPLSIRWLGPFLIPKGVETTLSVEIERDGDAVNLTGSEWTLYDPSGNVLSTGNGSVSSGVHSYTVAASETSTESYGKHYMVRLSGTDELGVAVDSPCDAALVSMPLYCPVGQADLLARKSDIVRLLPTERSDLGLYITQAWAEFKQDLYDDGVPFWTLRTPGALRKPVMSLCYALIYEDFSELMNAGDKYDLLAERYRERYASEFGRIRSLVDSDEDNSIEAEHKSAAPVLRLTSGRRLHYRWGE